MNDDSDWRGWISMSVIAAKISTNQADTLSLQKLEQVMFVRRWIIEVKIVESRRERHCLVDQ